MKNIFIFWVSSIFISSFSCYASSDYKILLDSLIKNQNYSEALHLADRLLYFTTDSSRNELIITKSKLLIIANQPYDSYVLLSEIINNINSNPKIISESLIYIAFAFIKMGDYNSALYFIETSVFEESWKNTRNLLAAYCYFMIGDSKTSKEQFNYIGIDKTDKLFYDKKIKKLTIKKNINTAISFIIPGYVYLLKKKYGYGISALGLNAGLMVWFGTVSAISPLDAFIFVMPITMRYYFGTQSRIQDIYKLEIVKLKNEQFKKFYQENKLNF